MESFKAQVSDWVKASEARLTAVFRASVQSLVHEVQKTKAEGGHMPVDTGFLRASLLASKTAMPSLKTDAKPEKDQSYPNDASSVELTIAGASPGRPFYLGFTANYALHQEYVNGFVRLTAQRWQEIVDKSIQDIAYGSRNRD